VRGCRHGDGSASEPGLVEIGGRDAIDIDLVGLVGFSEPGLPRGLDQRIEPAGIGEGERCLAFKRSVSTRADSFFGSEGERGDAGGRGMERQDLADDQGNPVRPAAPQIPTVASARPEISEAWAVSPVSWGQAIEFGLQHRGEGKCLLPDSRQAQDPGAQPVEFPCRDVVPPGLHRPSR
jgi:hypothetical protein